jgi:fatty acid desaturase
MKGRGRSTSAWHNLSPTLVVEGSRTNHRAAAGVTDYAKLKRVIQEAGLLRKQPYFYLALISINTMLLALCLAGFVIFKNPWVVALNAIALAVISGQHGFQLHDAGHHQMFARKWKNTVIGFVTADLLLGMSYGWWVQKHNRHHANPNHVDLDPDINNPAIVYTEEQALRRRGPLRLLARYQAYLFFPLLGLLAWSMHLTGAVFLATRRSHYRRLEIVTLLAHLAIYVGFLVYFLGPWSALLVIVIHKAIGGFYLASVFAPNHKGMLQTSDESDLDFLRAQVLTSRNIRGSLLTDLLFGSLNYQVEHHLFPAMPRNRVRHANRIVREFCRQAGVSYYETSVFQSYRELLAFLHSVGAPLRSRGLPKQPNEAEAAGF